MSFAQLMVAGTLAGVLQMLVTYPIETVRTRMTLSGNLLPGGVKYSGIWQCAKATVAVEGLGALYKGLAPAPVSGAPYVGMQMTLYELGKTFAKNHLFSEYVPIPMVNMMVGAVSGVTAQTIFYPGDTVRRRMQANGIAGEKKIYSSSWHCVKTIIVKEGVIAGLFEGCWANVVKAVPGGKQKKTAIIHSESFKYSCVAICRV